MRRLLAAAGIAVSMLVATASANAEIPASLKSSCTPSSAAPGYSYEFCNDGVPPVAGLVPNIGGVRAVRVPAKYDGYAGLPAKSADAATMPGADPDGFVALDVDISKPTTPPPPGGYPLLVFMHGCCAGTKGDWESTNVDGNRETWHFNNAWFASRGYVVVNYTARGFRAQTQGSTGQTQLDSRLFEINDFQYLAGLVADDPSFQVNPQKVVPTGGSYGGGFAWLALTDPKWRSPGGLDMKLAASAPRYGWTDITYSILPNGHHSKDPDQLPAFDGSDTIDPIGMPKISWISVLFGSGFIGTTFPQFIVDANTCTQYPYPLDAVPACQATIQSTLPSFIADRSAYYQNDFFDRIATDPSYRIPVFNAGTFSDTLFTSVESLRMSNRLQNVVPDYPIQQYFGDYEHFTQNKAREWGDICGADHHVCAVSDYPGGNVDATPNGLVRTGVTTRLNRFIDFYTRPSADPNPPAPKFDVTASLQICPQNADAAHPVSEPGDTYTAPTFRRLAPYHLGFSFSGDQQTANDVDPNPHGVGADPIGNAFTNGSRCPFTSEPAGPGVAVYESAPLAEQATMIGGGTVSVDYDATSTAGLQLNARLYDVFPDGTMVLVDRGPYRATSLGGTANFEFDGNGWRFPAGHRVRIEVAQDAVYLKPSSVASTATIHGVRLTLPVREPQRGDFRNAARFCGAQRAFLGRDAFVARYGKNRGKANAFGKCVAAG